MATDNTPCKPATSPIAGFVDNIANLNNGGIEQVATYLATQTAADRAQFIERCASMIGAVATKGRGPQGNEW